MLDRGISFFVVGLLAGVLLTTGAFALLQRSTDEDVVVLKLGHSLDQGHPVHLAMEYMAQLLDEKSSGTIRLEIFPNGQLGSETQCIEQLQRGVLDLTKTSTAPLESFMPQMGVFGVPYLFRDESHFWKVVDGDIGREIREAGEDVGIYGLCYYDAGARSFYTVDTPILKPQDLTGLKIRVQESETAIKMVNALGGSPTPMDFGELYSGLQTRMVDGAENNPPSFHSNRHFEVCKDYSLDEHTRVPDVLLISQSTWKKLSQQMKTWIEEAAAESSLRQRDLWKQKTKEALDDIVANGVRLHRPDLSLFAEQVKSLQEEYQTGVIGELMDRIGEVE